MEKNFALLFLISNTFPNISLSIKKRDRYVYILYLRYKIL